MTTQEPQPDPHESGSTPPPPPPPGPPPGVPMAGAPAGAAGAVTPLQSDETVWALLAHLSIFVLGLIGPLIIMLVAGDQRPFARAHAVEALNFHITVFIAMVVSAILIIVIIGIFMMLLVGLAAIVLAIMAAVKASQGEMYRYPFTLRLVS